LVGDGFVEVNLVKLLIFLFALVFLITACNLSTTPDTALPTPTQGVDTSPGNDTASNNTYTGTIVGFAFDYPTGWTVPPEPPPADAVAYSITIASYNYLDPDVQSRGEPDWTTSTKIDVNVQSAGDANPIEMMYQSIQTDASEGTSEILREEERSLQDGSPARYIRLRDRFGSEASIFLTEINGRGISVVAYGDEAYFDQITRSLRPV
jgi:hypothetical protein